MNWSYYIVTKDTSQIIGYANNFAEAYNQASEKKIDCYILQGTILTELTASELGDKNEEKDSVESIDNIE